MFDSIIIELILNNKNIIFSSIYRTPNIDNVSFTMFFNLLFPTLFKYVDRKMIICSDFNIDLKNCNICKNAEIFLEKLHELGCSPMINRPTRIDLNKNSFTIIDNFFTNLYCATFSGIVISDLSDHFPIILSLDINKSID